ncbi:EamA family transporter [Nocardioides montaniterrae]
MTVLLALTSALLYGISDFVGGLASRRTSAWPVAVMSGAGALVGAMVLSLVDPGTPTHADWWWAALAGAAGGTGIAFLYRGFAAGQMAVAGPVSAVGTALLPVAVGVATGESLGPWTWVGITAAVPGLWLVARTPSEEGVEPVLAEGLVDGALAGVGFGVAFTAMGQWSDHAGFAPFLLLQVVNMLTVVALATAFRQAWIPRRPAVLGGGLAGLVAAGALLCFVVAVGGADLAVSSVLASLYPAVTVVMALAILRERITAAQGLGLLLCGATVALVAAG